MKQLRMTIAAMSAVRAASLPSASVYRPTESETLHAVDDYRRAGIIPEMLRRNFNQNGYWIGEKRAWSQATRSAANAVMRGTKLPADEVVTCADGGGVVLNTSYISKAKKDVVIPYQEIRGSCSVGKNGTLSAPFLRRVMGSFVCETRRGVDLPLLHQVDGDFRVPYSHCLSSPGLAHVGGAVTIREYVLPALETVGGRLFVRFTHKIDAARLYHVGKSINASTVQWLRLPELQFVGGNLRGSFVCNRIDAPKLKIIGGHFYAPEARVINARGLEMVGWDLNSQACRHFFSPRLQVGGFWSMHPEAAGIWKIEEAARRSLRERPEFDL